MHLYANQFFLSEYALSKTLGSLSLSLFSLSSSLDLSQTYGQPESTEKSALLLPPSQREHKAPREPLQGCLWSTEAKGCRNFTVLVSTSLCPSRTPGEVSPSPTKLTDVPAESLRTGKPIASSLSSELALLFKKCFQGIKIILCGNDLKNIYN